MHIDETNFIDIISQHEKIMFKVSNAYCKNPEDRRDIVQEIIIQLWRSKTRYKPEFRISTWIYRISLNVAISHYRKESRRKNAQISMDDHLIEIADDQDGKEEDPRILALNNFINQLDKLNKALMLLYLDDFSYREIADMLGISETNVATKLNRLKKNIRKEIKLKESINH